MSAMLPGRPGKVRERSHVCDKHLTHTFTTIVNIVSFLVQCTYLCVCLLALWWWKAKAGQQPLAEVREEVSMCEVVGGGVVTGQELQGCVRGEQVLQGLQGEGDCECVCGGGGGGGGAGASGLAGRG